MLLLLLFSSLAASAAIFLFVSDRWKIVDRAIVNDTTEMAATTVAVVEEEWSDAIVFIVSEQ